MNTKERAVHTLLTRLRGPVGADPLRRRPWKAWRQVPVLFRREDRPRLEPAKGIYDRVADVADLDGVVDAAVWVGYAWADEPRCQAAVVVTGDDREVVAREAEDLARRYWDARADFRFVGPTATLHEALDLDLRRARSTPPSSPTPATTPPLAARATSRGRSASCWPARTCATRPSP